MSTSAGATRDGRTGCILLTSALTVLLCLLGVVGLVGGTAVRVSADVAGIWVLVVYLGSPGLFARAGLRGVDSMAGGLAGRN